MKKITSLILSIITLAFIICSCGKNTKPIETETDENGEIITTATKEQATTKNTGKETTSTTQKNGETSKTAETTALPEKHDIRTGYKISSPFTELPSRVLITRGTSRLSYYSKADGNLYTFCYDPLCDHQDLYCVSQKFIVIKNNTPVYSSITNRLYFSRAENIFSVKFDGTDIKLEVSFGERGKDLNSIWNNKGVDITYLQVYDEYLYFIYPTVAETIYDGNQSESINVIKTLFRYNMKTKKLENLFENVGYESKYFSNYFLGSNKVFFIDVTEDRGRRMFSVNLDLTGIKEIDSDLIANISPENLVFDGNDFYMFSYEENNGQITQCIVCYDPLSNEIKEIVRADLTESIYPNKKDGAIKLLAVTDEYIYYSQDNPFLIGIHHTKRGDDYRYTNYHTTYRVNKDGTGKTLVFEGVKSNDPKIASYAIEELYVLEGSVIAYIWENKYTMPETLSDGTEIVNWESVKFVTFDIAPDGSFVNMHELVLDE